MCICTYMCTGNTKTPIAMNQLVFRYCLLLFPSKRNPDSRRNGWLLRLIQNRFEVSVDHLVTWESKPAWKGSYWPCLRQFKHPNKDSNKENTDSLPYTDNKKRKTNKKKPLDYSKMQKADWWMNGEGVLELKNYHLQPL